MAINFANGGSQDRPMKCLAAHRFEWNTRTGSSNTNGTGTVWIYQSSFTKISASSLITVQAIFPAWNNNAGTVQGVMYVGNQNEESGIYYSYNDNGFGKIYHCNSSIANNTQTGTVNFGIGYRSNSGGNERPFSGVWNPSSSDDSRLLNTGAIITVMELVQ